jgi:hypothetical protein
MYTEGRLDTMCAATALLHSLLRLCTCSTRQQLVLAAPQASATTMMVRSLCNC